MIEGLYVVGSVDVVAVLAEPADDETGGRLRRAHDRDREAARGAPSVDGPFVAWADLSIPPGPWRNVLDEPPREVEPLGEDGRLPGATAEWCLLGACRMLVTAATGDVASKRGAGLRVAAELPEHAPAIHLCLALRGTESAISADDARAVVDAMAAVLDTIA